MGFSSDLSNVKLQCSPAICWWWLLVERHAQRKRGERAKVGKEREREKWMERGEEIEWMDGWMDRYKSSICWLTPKMTARTKARPGKSQELCSSL